MVKFRKSLALLLSLTLVVSFALSGIVLPVSADTATEEPIDLLNGLGAFDEGTNWQQTIFSDAGTDEAAIVADPTGAAGNTVLRLGTETEGSHTLGAYLKMAKLWDPETETYTAKLQAGKSYTLTFDVYGAAARLYFEPRAVVFTSGGVTGWNTMSSADGWTTYKFVFYPKDNVADTANGGYHADWWSWAFNLVKSSSHGSIADYTYIDNVTLKETVADTITLDATSATLEPGEKLTLAATLGPDRSIQYPVVFSSNADAVATVDAETGVVTAVADGTATITATSGDLTATCTVKVQTYGVMDMSAFHYSAAITNGNGQAVAAGDPVPSYTDADGTEYLWVEPGNNSYTKLAKVTLPKITAGEWIAVTFKARVHNAGADNAGQLRAHAYFTDVCTASAGWQPDFYLQGANTNWVWVTYYLQADADRTNATIGFQNQTDSTAKKLGYDVADLRVWKVSADEMNLLGYSADFEHGGVAYAMGGYNGNGLITSSGEFVKESDGNTAFHFTSGTGTKYFIPAAVMGSGNTELGVRIGTKLKVSWRQKGGTVSFAPTSNYAGTTKFVLGTPTTASTDWETVTVYVDATNATSFNRNYALGFTFSSGVYIDDLEMYEVTDATAIDLVVDSEMGKGATQAATIATTKKHAYIDGVTFESDTPGVATVDAATGVITGVDYGTANITATVTVGSATFTSTKTVEVKKPVATGLKLDITTSKLTVGGTVTLTPSVLPDGADAPAAYTWESSDPTVATVVDGVVTTKKAGEATITVSAEGLTSATCVVTVIEAGDFINGLGTFEDANGAYSSSLLSDVYAGGTIVTDPTNANNKVLMIPNQTNVDAGTYTYGRYFKYNKLYDILTGNYNKTMEPGKAYTLTFDVYGEAVALYVNHATIVGNNGEKIQGASGWTQFGGTATASGWKTYTYTFYPNLNSPEKHDAWHSWYYSVAKGGNGASYSSTNGPTYIDNITLVEAKASEITLDQTEGTLALGTTTTLTPTFGPENTRVPSELVWESDDEDVATVENGVVTAVGKGQAVISVTADGITTPATFTVTVKGPPATAITLNKTEVSLEIGGTETLTVSGVPADSEVPTITWESDNTKVATVVDGLITAVAPGTATITVTAEGLAPVTCTVTVNWPTEYFVGKHDGTMESDEFVDFTWNNNSASPLSYTTLDGNRVLKVDPSIRNAASQTEYFQNLSDLNAFLKPNSLYRYSVLIKSDYASSYVSLTYDSRATDIEFYGPSSQTVAANGEWKRIYAWIRTGDSPKWDSTTWNLRFAWGGSDKTTPIYLDDFRLTLIDDYENRFDINGDMEYADANLDGYGANGVIVTEADGNKALRLSNLSKSSRNMFETIPFLAPNAVYEISFDSKVDQDWLNAGAVLRLYWHGGNAGVRRVFNGDFANDVSFKMTTEWQKNTFYIYTNSATTLENNTFYFDDRDAEGAGYFYLDNFSVKRVDNGNSVHGAAPTGGYDTQVSIDGGETWVSHVIDVPAGTVVTVRPRESADRPDTVLTSLTVTTNGGTAVNVLNKDVVNGYTADNFGTGDGRVYQYVKGEGADQINAVLADASSTSFKLDTVGTSLRYTEDDNYDGIRFLTRLQLKKGSFDAETGVITVLKDGVEYTVVEMGSKLCRSSAYDSTLAPEEIVWKWNSVAYTAGGDMKLLDYTETYVDFTVVMTKGANVAQEAFEAREYAACGYIVLEDAEGNQVTIYSENTQIDSVDSVQARM
ncbi:MAG: Ig-like domain-containing protein [Clostridia bacterium]|nr:Ig-like domain-containing protein [Clostridia bacterium]